MNLSAPDAGGHKHYDPLLRRTLASATPLASAVARKATVQWLENWLRYGGRASCTAEKHSNARSEGVAGLSWHCRASTTQIEANNGVHSAIKNLKDKPIISSARSEEGIICGHSPCMWLWSVHTLR